MCVLCYLDHKKKHFRKILNLTDFFNLFNLINFCWFPFFLLSFFSILSPFRSGVISLDISSSLSPRTPKNSVTKTLFSFLFLEPLSRRRFTQSLKKIFLSSTFLFPFLSLLRQNWRSLCFSEWGNISASFINFNLLLE